MSIFRAVDYSEWILLFHNLSSLTFIMTSFVVFLFCYTQVFDSSNKWFNWIKPTEVKKCINKRPIRSGLSLVAFMDFIAITLPFFMGPPFTPNGVIRSFIFRLFIFIGNIFILWISVHVSKGDWEIYKKPERKRMDLDV